MRMSDITQQIYELQEDIETFMEELSGDHYDCIIAIEGDTTKIKLDGDLEFIEVVLDEFENFYVEIQSPTFEYTEELLEFLEDLEF
jgi:hypothetical protein